MEKNPFRIWRGESGGGQNIELVGWRLIAGGGDGKKLEEVNIELGNRK